MRKQFKKWCAWDQAITVANGPGLTWFSHRLCHECDSFDSPLKVIQKVLRVRRRCVSASRRGRETCLGHRLRLVA